MDHGTSSSYNTHWQSRRSKNLRKQKLKTRHILSVTPLLFLPLLFSFFPNRDGVIKNAEAHHIITEVLQVKPQPTKTTTPITSLINFPDQTETEKPTSTPPQKKPEDTREQIRSYIKEVFGKDQDKAFKLLECENESLDPDAVNTAGNYPEGSRDIGVFQINEYWQETQGKFLFNWKVNVLIAKQLYDESGKSFTLWTCGKSLNI